MLPTRSGLFAAVALLVPSGTLAVSVTRDKAMQDAYAAGDAAAGEIWRGGPPPALVLAHDAALMMDAASHKGVMRREASDPASLVEGAARAAWSPREVTSTNNVDLNGHWVSSASGETRVISDNVATGDGNFRVNVYIKQGGRRVEFEHAGRNYWATLSGRGSLNWNDGTVWTRKVDCKWADWTDFGACGGPCAAGEQQRQREYEYLQENGGQPCVGPLLRCQESAYCAAAVVVEEASSSSEASDASGASGASAASGASGSSSSGASGASASGHSLLAGEAHGSHLAQESAFGMPWRSGSQGLFVATPLLAAAAAALVA